MIITNELQANNSLKSGQASTKSWQQPWSAFLPGALRKVYYSEQRRIAQGAFSLLEETNQENLLPTNPTSCVVNRQAEISSASVTVSGSPHRRCPVGIPHLQGCRKSKDLFDFMGMAAD